MTGYITYYDLGLTRDCGMFEDVLEKAGYFVNYKMSRFAPLPRELFGKGLRRCPISRKKIPFFITYAGIKKDNERMLTACENVLVEKHGLRAFDKVFVTSAITLPEYRYGCEDCGC